MYEVQTDHRVDVYGDDVMKLVDWRTGDVLVMASRVGGVWTIQTPGLADTTAVTRQAAVTSMIGAALESQPGAGYSTWVPDEITGMD